MLKLKEEVEYEHLLERVELNPSEEVLMVTVEDGS